MKEHRKYSDFTLIELLIMIAILSILFSLFLPQLARSKEHAYITVCMNNLRQVAIAFQTYIQDYNGEMPITEYWLDDFEPVYSYVKSNAIFTCPKTGTKPGSVWDAENNLRNGDFSRGGNITDIEKNNNYNNGHGNNPYHFDISNPSPQTPAVVAAKQSARLVYEKRWDNHLDGQFFNVVYIDDGHYEKEYNGVTAYWTLDDRGWIETSLDPFPSY
jgi:type II secretory pathway pseudopilin PulG